MDNSLKNFIVVGCFLDVVSESSFKKENGDKLIGESLPLYITMQINLVRDFF